MSDSDRNAELYRKCKDLEELEKEGELTKAELGRRATDPDLPHDQQCAARDALKNLEASNASGLVALELAPENFTIGSEHGSWRLSQDSFYSDLARGIEHLVTLASEGQEVPEGVSRLDYLLNRLSCFLWCIRDSKHLRLASFERSIDGEIVEFRLRRIERVATAMGRFLRMPDTARHEGPPTACPAWLHCSLAILRSPDGEYRTVRTPKEEWRLIKSGWISRAVDPWFPERFLQEQMEVWPQSTDHSAWSEELEAAVQTVDSVDSQEAYDTWRSELPPGARVHTSVRWTPADVATFKRMVFGGEQPAGSDSRENDEALPAQVAIASKRRGRPVEIPVERKAEALAIKRAGGTNRDAAVKLYGPYPTRQQIKSTSTILRKFKAAQETSAATE